MRKGFFGTVATLLASSGLGLAQAPTPPITVVPSTINAPVAATGPACAAPVSDIGDNCAQGTHIWASAEYLLWWVKNGPINTPLVTAGSAADAVPGALGQPGTTVLFGNKGVDYGPFSGARLTVGAWSSPDGGVGLEWSGFILGSRSKSRTFASDPTGAQVIGNPFFSALNGTEDVALVSLPGTIFGSTSVSSSSRLWGNEVNAVFGVSNDSQFTIKGLVGFRYADLRETLAIESIHSPVAGSGVLVPFNGILFPEPAAVATLDGFNTRNQFYGGQIGAQADIHKGNLFGAVTAKVAFGSTHQTADINGSTTLLNGPAGVTPTTVPGGLYALASNSGHFTRDQFSVIPEVELKVGYDVTSNVSAFVGYNFMYWTDVVRPGNQIDRTINVNQVPSFAEFGTPGGPARPAFNFNDSGFWAQGIDFGVQFRY